ncbi:unnamed protein product [Fusarium venenatum]|uniref:Uncharacterized protein n=1 Tax=Fusarium venenatum TaxID=56646 RepID=A0A2L2TL24_9HYPO|nr:LOW QUALITY PROTEIN: uncharacterized protein FVRRES_10886 [Fusarium venenatum]CEI70809.1 unnamed protein product [Fusarium venenatum]
MDQFLSAASHIQTFGGILDDPEIVVTLASESLITFSSKTSGDFDGVDILFSGTEFPKSIIVTGLLGGYVKVGNALAGNPHKPQPQCNLDASREGVYKSGGKRIEITGGVDMFVSAEVLDDVSLPRRVEGPFEIHKQGAEELQPALSVYFVGRESSGGKAMTSPIFILY